MKIKTISVNFPFKDPADKFLITHIGIDAELEENDNVEECYLDLKDKCEKLYSGKPLSEVTKQDPQKSVSEPEPQMDATPKESTFDDLPF